MQLASLGLLVLSLFVNVRTKVDPTVRRLKARYVTGVARPQQNKPLTSGIGLCKIRPKVLNSKSGLKADRERGLHRDGPPVHDIGFELPQLHAVDRGLGEGQRALQELGVLHGAVASNQNL